MHPVDAVLVASHADRSFPDDLCSLDYNGAPELAHALRRDHFPLITVTWIL
jgi:hypothetical protein